MCERLVALPETADILEKLAATNEDIPAKAAGYRKCAQIIRERIKNSDDWQKQEAVWKEEMMAPSNRWWENQK